MKITSIKCIYVQIYIFFCLCFSLFTRNSPMLNMSTKGLFANWLSNILSLNACFERIPSYTELCLVHVTSLGKGRKTNERCLCMGLITHFWELSSTIWTSPGKNPTLCEKSRREDPIIWSFHLFRSFHQLTSKISQVNLSRKQHPAETQNQDQIYVLCCCCWCCFFTQ